MIESIAKGLQITEPNVFIPWNTSERKLLKLLKGSTPEKVGDGYYTLSVLLFGDLQCMLGFYFATSKKNFLSHRKNTLDCIGIFRSAEYYEGYAYNKLTASFTDFQSRLEKAFGIPTSTIEGSQDYTGGFPSYTWEIGEITIRHYVFERFGLGEHLRIQIAT